MEVESGFLVRDVQEQIARQMRTPQNRQNAVLQLNMGEGKSSVIAPVVAASMSGGSQLVRMIVAKPQSKQMAQMLISKVGGLVNRLVYYMPFSRSLKLNTSTISFVSSMLRECMKTGGILLMQPEHILQTYGIGLLHRRTLVISSTESDENLSTRFELIYPMGTQRTIELAPDRWFQVQQVLEILRRLSFTIGKELPTGSIEVVTRVDGSCPRVRILRSEAGPLLVARIGEEICKNGLDGFHLSRQSPHVRQAVYEYLTTSSPSATTVDAAECSPIWTDATRSHLLMLRGLLAEGVLTFALGQKRWRVNYGLATRTPPTALAVPYRAKDSPWPRSEFSHPDIVIVLTSLSYYYGGLGDSDLFTAPGHLSDSNEADPKSSSQCKGFHYMMYPSTSALQH